LRGRTLKTSDPDLARTRGTGGVCNPQAVCSHLKGSHIYENARHLIGAGDGLDAKEETHGHTEQVPHRR
jgi:hypothetical protein